VQIWNAVLVCILISDVVWLPIETAFGRTLSKFLMFWFNMLSTMFFTTDMVLQFFFANPLIDRRLLDIQPLKDNPFLLA